MLLSQALEAARSPHPMPKAETLAHYADQAALLTGKLPSGMVRAQWLIDANVKRYTSKDGTDIRWHMVAADHEATIRALADRLNVAEGYNLTAERGCRLTWLTFGPIEVAVEYEFERGQREIIAADPDKSQEGIAPSVSVLRVYLNGYWCDAEDVASEKQIERWEETILEGGDE